MDIKDEVRVVLRKSEVIVDSVRAAQTREEGIAIVAVALSEARSEAEMRVLDLVEQRFGTARKSMVTHD